MVTLYELIRAKPERDRIMRDIRQDASLITILLLCASIAHPQKRCTNLAPSASFSDSASMQPDSPYAPSDKEGEKLLIVADNQEHVLTGTQLFSMGLLSEIFLSSTAMRPPLAHVGGRLVFGEALRFGRRQGVGTVLHLGDATNISCRNELTSVFNTLNKEAVDEEGNKIWFMAPGNHDGMLAGNLTGYQPPLDYHLTEAEVNKFYSEQRRESLSYRQKKWIGACLSPRDLEYTPDPEPDTNPKVSNEKPKIAECPPAKEHKPSTEVKDPDKDYDFDMLKRGILTRGDSIKLYVKELSARTGFSRISHWEESITVEDTNVICDVEKITLKSHNYTAISSICRITQLNNNPNTNAWVGPFASHIVQKLEVGGATILMLDTSDYDDPSWTQVPLKGELTCRQKAHADYLLFGENGRDALDFKNRDKVIIAGHHPISDFPHEEQEWIVERTSRYLSAHVHASTKLITHKLSEQLRAVELNVASTLDYPQQAVIAKITPPAEMTFRVVEAGGSKTKSPGFLERCAKEKYWELPASYYKGYWRGVYGNRLLDSLEKAAERAPPGSTLKIPSGKSREDWNNLEKFLKNINSFEGEARDFWACQSFYASKALGRDRSAAEWIKSGWGWVKSKFRRPNKSACDAATGDWFSFSPPETRGRS